MRLACAVYACLLVLFAFLELSFGEVGEPLTSSPLVAPGNAPVPGSQAADNSPATTGGIAEAGGDVTAGAPDAATNAKVTTATILNSTFAHMTTN